MQLKILTKYLAGVMRGIPLAVCFLALPQHPALAQSQPIIEENDYPEANEPAYGEKFKEAEQALLEGLSRRPDEDGAEPLLRNASVVKPVAPKTQTTDGVVIVRKKGASPMVQEQGSDAEASVKGVSLQNAPRVIPRESGAVGVLQKKLTASEKRAQDLERQLSEAKSQLYAAEIEINRLSGLVSPSSRARLNSNAIPATRSPAQESEALRRVSPKNLDDVVAPAPNADLQVATVTVDKADLRLGPGKNHSALMPVRRGSRLMVEVRQGEWYRVYAPNGQRAWIHSSLVRFGEGSASLNDGSSVRIKGFNADAEQEQFRKLGSITAGE